MRKETQSHKVLCHQILLVCSNTCAMESQQRGYDNQVAIAESQAVPLWPAKLSIANPIWP